MFIFYKILYVASGYTKHRLIKSCLGCMTHVNIHLLTPLAIGYILYRYGMHNTNEYHHKNMVECKKLMF